MFRNRHHLMVESMSYTNLLRKEKVTQMEEELGLILVRDAHELAADPSNSQSSQTENKYFQGFLEFPRIFQNFLRFSRMSQNFLVFQFSYPSNSLRPALQRMGEVFAQIAKIRTERDYLIKSRIIAPLKKAIVTESSRV